MAEVFENKGKKYWRNAEGELIPLNRVFPHEKKSDALVERVIRRVKKLQEKVAAEKKRISEDIEKYLKIIAAENGEEWEGNATIYNFAKTKQIEVRISKHFVTDERLAIAKQKIDALIMKWSGGSNENIIALINKAFQIDKKGNIDVKRLIGLRDLKIKDKEWKAAMELILDSISVDSTKSYFNFREKFIYCNRMEY